MVTFIFSVLFRYSSLLLLLLSLYFLFEQWRNESNEFYQLPFVVNLLRTKFLRNRTITNMSNHPSVASTKNEFLFLACFLFIWKKGALDQVSCLSRDITNLTTVMSLLIQRSDLFEKSQFFTLSLNRFMGGKKLGGINLFVLNWILAKYYHFAFQFKLKQKIDSFN